MTDVVGAAVAPPAAGGAPEPAATRLRGLRRLAGRPSALIALVFLVLLTLAAVLAPLVAPYGPMEQDLEGIHAGPSAAHLLGQDDLGRDILSRLIFGARVSLASSVMAVALALVIALPLGLASGYVGGKLDSVLMRIVDGLQSIPPLVMAITIAGLLGPSLRNIVLALAVIFTPTFIRLVRGQTLAVKEEAYIEAARSVGGSSLWIARKRILHNIASPMIVQTSITLGFGLLAEAGLSFLGLGIQPPEPSWGGMLAGAYASIYTEGWAILPAGGAILVTVWAFNLLGDGMRDLLGRRK